MGRSSVKYHHKRLQQIILGAMIVTLQQLPFILLFCQNIKKSKLNYTEGGNDWMRGFDLDLWESYIGSNNAYLSES